LPGGKTAANAREDQDEHGYDQDESSTSFHDEPPGFLGQSGKNGQDLPN
jgi:hypothetical protein